MSDVVYFVHHESECVFKEYAYDLTVEARQKLAEGLCEEIDRNIYMDYIRQGYAHD